MPHYPSTRRPVYARRSMVATRHPLAAIAPTVMDPTANGGNSTADRNLK